MNWKTQLMVVILSANTLFVFGATNVTAEEANASRNYMQLKLGVLQPSGDRDDADFDTGFSGALAYGRYLTDNLILEATYDVSVTDKELQGSNSTTGNYDQDNYLATEAILLTLKGEYPVGPFRVFGGGGIGWYGACLNGDIDTEKIGSFDVNDTDSAFGLHVVAGANYDFNDRFFMGLEGTYRWTDDIEINKTAASVPVDYSGDLSGFTLTLNAGFRF